MHRGVVSTQSTGHDWVGPLVTTSVEYELDPSCTQGLGLRSRRCGLESGENPSPVIWRCHFGYGELGEPPWVRRERWGVGVGSPESGSRQVVQAGWEKQKEAKPTLRVLLNAENKVRPGVLSETGSWSQERAENGPERTGTRAKSGKQTKGPA